MTAVLEHPELPDQSTSSRSGLQSTTLEGRVGTLLCLLPALYLLGVVGFAAINPIDFMGSAPQAVRYVVAPGVLFLLLLWTAFRVRAQYRFAAGSIACGVLIALFLFEAILELRYIQIIRAMVGAEVRQPMHWDPLGLPPGRTSKQLSTKIGVTKLNEAVLGAVPGSVVDLCRTGNVQVRYRADKFGFRNPYSAFAYPTSDILLIGDSFVEGICLPEGQDLAGRVRARESSTLSFGIRGAGPLLELAILGRFGPLVRPAWTVIVFYEGNDWENLQSELTKPWLMEALGPAPDFGPAEVSPATLHAARTQIAQWDQSGPVGTSEVIKRGNVGRNFMALHQTWTRLGLGYPKSAPDNQEFRLILQQGRKLASQWGGRVAMVYLPQSTRFMGVFPNSFAYDPLRRKVLRAAESVGIPVMDMTPLFASAPEPMTLYGENHLSPAGADLVARTVKATLDDLRGRNPK